MPTQRVLEEAFPVNAIGVQKLRDGDRFGGRTVRFFEQLDEKVAAERVRDTTAHDVLLVLQNDEAGEQATRAYFLVHFDDSFVQYQKAAESHPPVPIGGVPVEATRDASGTGA